jgi:carbohydrate kinase (thermoresistant glucokinase family)
VGATGARTDPRRIVVMGVSGCGKSTVGAALARALGVEYVEGDDFHPPHNVAKMAAGQPLTDADRLGWLQGLARRLNAAQVAGHGLVLSCSALKRSYRDVLRAQAEALVFVHVNGSRELLARRLAERVHRYMPATLLDSQLDTLEPPSPDENALTVDAAEPVERIVQTLLDRLAAGAPTP